MTRLLRPRSGRADPPEVALAKDYRRTRASRLVDRAFTLLTRLGLGASYRHVLTVPGRKTGRLYSTPVDIVEADGRRWLVAGYGPSAWTKNVRAAGEVTLSRGGKSSRFAAELPTRAEAVGALRAYIDGIRVTRPYFDARADSPDDEVARELARHPVFRLVPLDADAGGGGEPDAASG